MSTLNYKGIKYTHEEFHEVNDSLVVEGPLKIFINGEVFTITMRCPGNDEELVRGLLFTEDVYKDKNENPVIEILKKDNLDHPVEVNVKINPEKIRDNYLNKRNLLSVTSCGICGKTELEDLHNTSHASVLSSAQLDPALVGKMFDSMNSRQSTFKQSGGSHASAAFTLHGELLSLQEDIGRHNAVDKVIGDLLIGKKLNEAKCLIVSGRISYEIVSKCFIAGIPFLASVSAPSSLAVDFSKELGITLMAFCRNNYFTVYSHPEKIKDLKENNNWLKAI